jgi:putative Mg2+ transporter-C (MgtC) family protein
MLQSIIGAMDKAGHRLTGVESDAVGELQRISFPLTAVTREHERMKKQLAAEPGIDKLVTFRDPEED